jgi:hypothetical protein
MERSSVGIGELVLVKSKKREKEKRGLGFFQEVLEAII